MRSVNNLRNVQISGGRRGGLFVPVAGLWGLALVAGLAFFVFDGGFGAALGDFYLVPWALGAGAIVLAPAAYYYYRGEFDLFHPLVFGVWSYIFPAFVVGAFIITFNMTNNYVMLFVTDPEYTLPLSLVYVSIGFIGVVAGFYLPVGQFAADRLSRFSPKGDWDLDKVWFPGVVLTLSGLAISILGILQGVLGFQRVDQVGAFDSVVVFLTYIFNVGYVLLWLAIFQTRKRNGLFYLIIAFLVMMIPLRMALQGGRSSLMLSVISIAVAFWYSGRRLKWQHTSVFGAILVVSIFIGIIYGTTFRRIKGSEERINAGDYVGQIAETFDYISRADTSMILSEGFSSMAERIENLSSLGVVVANYEKLEPYEESYGLKNNIVNDLLTSFVPRIVWADKPNTSDPRAYSELYFDYGDNSFAITPFGDLLRNFGVIGIPLGMMIIGVYYRLIYSYLIATPESRIWKKVAYYPLLAAVSFESFYATFFPIVLRVFFVVVVSVVFTSFFARKFQRDNRFQ
ncbi:MAG: oligosaccharide repeat unit polymerase [Acidobacteria bacterium]|nr:oligosaccharide repeat unit polymerase [Acidobacteriota bacterium]